MFQCGKLLMIHVLATKHHCQELVDQFCHINVSEDFKPSFDNTIMYKIVHETNRYANTGKTHSSKLNKDLRFTSEGTSTDELDVFLYIQMMMGIHQMPIVKYISTMIFFWKQLFLTSV
jgi:hypothetical protein